MYDMTPTFLTCGRRLRGAWLLGLTLVLLGATSAFSAGTDKQDRAAADPAVLGKSVSIPGLLLARGPKDKAWRALKAEASVYAGEELMALAGDRAEVDLRPEGIRLSLVGLLPDLYPTPSLESAVRLHRDKSGALDLTLLRGRAVLANQRKKGDARIWVKFLKEAWEIVLDEPGAEVVVERYNGWPPGVELSKKAGAAVQPETHVLLLTSREGATLRNGAEQYALKALTGYLWNTMGGAAGPLPSKAMPSFLQAKKTASPRTEALRAGAETLRRLMAEKPGAAVLGKALKDKDSGTRLAAVNAAAALGDTGLLLTALADAKNASVREVAVTALRHWLAQAGDHPAELYQTLLKQRSSPGQAETFLHLLHSFSGRDRTRPEIYDTLIDYLQHGDLRIRELARWQLYHMVPQGQAIPYDAGASPAERARARDAWRRLIPEGQLPPRAEKE